MFAFAQIISFYMSSLISEYRTQTLDPQITEGYTVKTWVLNNTPQFAAQFMGCYYNTDQVKGVKKGVKGDNWQSITPLTPLHRVLENQL